MRSGIFVIIGAMLVAASILVVGRYQISGDGDAFYRLDRWSGKIELCIRVPGTDPTHEIYAIVCPARIR